MIGECDAHTSACVIAVCLHPKDPTHVLATFGSPPQSAFVHQHASFRSPCLAARRIGAQQYVLTTHPRFIIVHPTDYHTSCIICARNLIDVWLVTLTPVSVDMLHPAPCTLPQQHVVSTLHHWNSEAERQVCGIACHHNRFPSRVLCKLQYQLDIPLTCWQLASCSMQVMWGPNQATLYQAAELHAYTLPQFANIGSHGIAARQKPGTVQAQHNGGQ